MSYAVDLSVRQSTFINEYLVDGVGSAAAVRSGVAKAGAHVWASRALRIPKVAAALQARQAADAARLGLARNDVVKGLLEAVEQAREQGNPMGMIRGWAEISRMMGFLAPARVQVTVSVCADVAIDRLSDQELMKIIDAGTERAAAPAEGGV